VAIVIPYVKQSWSDGSGGGTPESAARLGVIEEGILDVSKAPAVRVFHNANQSLTSGTPLALAFNTEFFDQAAGAASTQHDTVTNNSRLTCLYAGIYLVIGNASFAANATGYRQLLIRTNGTISSGNVVSPVNSGTLTTDLSVSMIAALAVNDYVELVAAQNSGGALNVLTAPNFSPGLMMARVG
jgi:hypothetical protein